MADERVGLQIDVEIAAAAKNVGELRKAFDDAKKKAVEIGKAFGENSEEFKKAEAALGQMVTQFKKFGDNKQALNESRQILQGIVSAYGATSKEAIAAAKAAASFKDEIGDADQLIQAFNPDRKFQAFSGAIQATVGGFAALQGAMGLFGGESKEVEKVLLKVQSAMALSQGINSILEAKDTFIALGTVIKTQVVGAFSTLRGAILSTGIGTLLLAIGSLIAYFKNLGDAADEAAEKQKEALEVRNKYADIDLKGQLSQIERARRLEVAGAKAKGQDVFKIEQDFRERRLRALQRHREEIKDDAAKLIEVDRQIADQKVEIEEASLNRIADLRNKKDKTPKGEKVKEDPRIEEARRLNEQLIEENDKYRLTEEERILKHYEKIRKILKDGKQSTLEEEIAKGRELEAVRQGELQTQLDAESQIKYDKLIQQSQKLLPLHQGIQISQTQVEKNNAEARKLIAEQEMLHKRDVLNAIGGLVGAAGELLGQQTAAGKAFAIASTLISTYQSAQKAYESQFAALNPTSPILANIAAAAAIVQGLARVKAIASVKVPGKGGSSFAGGSLAQNTQGGAQLNPALKTNTTVLDKKSVDDLANQALKVMVVESDITNSQMRIQRIKKSAIFG